MFNDQKTDFDLLTTAEQIARCEQAKKSFPEGHREIKEIDRQIGKLKKEIEK